jgi:hypothetical protein
MGSAGTTVSTDELIVATLDEQGREAFDQVFEKVPTFEWLRQNNKIRWDGSGYSIHVPIRIGKNTSSGKTSGYKTVTITPVSTINEVAYVMRRYYASVTYNQDMKDVNRGNKQIIDLVADKINEAKESIIDNCSTDLFAATTATDAFETLVAIADSTGAIGGVNQSSISSWAAYEAALGSFAAGGIEGMQLAFNTVGKGKRSGKPDLIVTDQTTFQYYQNALRAYGMDYFASKGDLGVDELKFSGARVIWDPDATSGDMFFLNSNALGLCIDGEANMKATEFVKPADQLAYVGQIYCRLATVCRERRALGKLTGITA